MEKASPTVEQSDDTSEKPRRNRIKELQRWLKERRGWSTISTNQETTGDTQESVERKGRGAKLVDKIRSFFMNNVAETEFVEESEKQPEESPDSTETVIETTGVQDVPQAEQAASGAERLNDKPPLVPPPIEFAVANAERRVAEDMVAPFSSVESTTPAPSIERVVEDRRSASAVGALLGLEFFARRRGDRKNRKEFRKEVKKLQKDQKNAEGKTTHVEDQTRMTKQDLEQLNVRQQAVETQPAAHIEHQKAPEPRLPASKEVELHDKQPEKPVVIEKIPMAEQVVQQADKLKKPEAVQERVEVAAEQNIPVEAIYERRHEKKDQPYEARNSNGGGSSGGNEPILLAEAIKARAAAQSAQASAASASKSGHLETPDHMYKNAVMTGIYGGVIVLVFIAVIVLIRS